MNQLGAAAVVLEHSRLEIGFELPACPAAEPVQHADLCQSWVLAQALKAASEEALQKSIAWFNEHLKV